MCAYGLEIVRNFQYRYDGCHENGQAVWETRSDFTYYFAFFVKCVSRNGYSILSLYLLAYYAELVLSLSLHLFE